MTIRSALAEAFWFIAYRSLIAAVIARVVLITGVFVLAFGSHARAAAVPTVTLHAIAMSVDRDSAASPASYENPMIVASDPYGIPFDRSDSVGIAACIRRFGGNTCVIVRSSLVRSVASC
ncbi:MAG: hypothetical protein ISP49_13885 [Reyranella sp.]|nr:hypothetical protein [Reyranella sp.]MBL6652682.1 hypothetical protein [Reyranella sp.]